MQMVLASMSICRTGNPSVPDAAYHVGPRTGMRFLEGSPIFAVEVRSENDYGPAAERAMQDKRADYFACGTLVVWDVDLLSEDVIKSYKASDPEHPVIFRRGRHRRRRASRTRMADARQ